MWVYPEICCSHDLEVNETHGNEYIHLGMDLAETGKVIQNRFGIWRERIRALEGE
jgi:hypothetical protein